MRHPTRSDILRKVAVVGCKHTTRDLILGLERHGYRIDLCVTIDADKADESRVAGYYDLIPFLKDQGIPFYVAEQYNLKNRRDREALLDFDIDLLLVMGWQRLIPDWWLESLSAGAFGMHGSNKPLPHGRGRSPMNWSLIQGKRLFYTHLFQYQPGVDDGPIVGVQVFDITPFDTCLTLHHKNLVAMTQLCVRHLPRLMDGTAELRPQPKEGASYYPKRTAEDGILYWSDATDDLYNLIRAATKPFPGAFTFLDDNPERRVLIWRAIPFDTHLLYPDAEPGEIVEVFTDGTFVVKTGDTTLLIQEAEGYEFRFEDVGRRFGSLGIARKEWPDLPR